MDSPKKTTKECMSSPEKDEVPTDSDMKRQYKDALSEDIQQNKLIDNQKEFNLQDEDHQAIQNEEGEEEYQQVEGQEDIEGKEMQGEPEYIENDDGQEEMQEFQVNQDMQEGEEQMNEEGQEHEMIQNDEEYQINEINPNEQNIPPEQLNNIKPENQNNQINGPGMYQYAEYRAGEQQNREIPQNQFSRENIHIKEQKQYTQTTGYNPANNEFNEYPVSQSNKIQQKNDEILANNENLKEISNNVEIKEYEFNSDENNAAHTDRKMDESPRVKQHISNYQESSYEPYPNEVEVKPKIKNDREPTDSSRNTHIEKKGVISKQNKPPLKKKIIKATKLLSFKDIYSNKVIADTNIDRMKLSGFVEIPREECEKYANNETIFFEGGLDTKQYKFQGEADSFRQDDFSQKIKISQEEINEELKKRAKKKKEEEIKYEILDKYYSLTEYEVKEISKEELIEKENINININNNNLKNKSEASEDINAPLDNYSKYLIESINKIRADPKSYIGKIEEAKANIKTLKTGEHYYNGKVKIYLSEGEPAFNEAIEFLKNKQPMENLTFSPKLRISVPKTLSEIKDAYDLKVKIERKIDSGINIKSYWRDIIKYPELSLLLMIVDDIGARRGMRRNDILNPNMKFIGISSVEMNGKFVSYITLSSSLNNY